MEKKSEILSLERTLSTQAHQISEVLMDSKLAMAVSQYKPIEKIKELNKRIYSAALDGHRHIVVTEDDSIIDEKIILALSIQGYLLIEGMNGSDENLKDVVKICW